MIRTCCRCSRTHPAEARYCAFDGTALSRSDVGPVRFGKQPFPVPLVFPSGRVCHNFDELALGCQEEWAEAVDLLRQGDLKAFMQGIGRLDLAQAAHAASRVRDPEQGLDQFVSRLPAEALDPPQLQVDHGEIDLGRLRPGENRQLRLRLINQGMCLLSGTVLADVRWLSLAGGEGRRSKLFQCHKEQTITVSVIGRWLRAGPRPLEGRLEIRSSGGLATVLVRAEVPVEPFAEGVLAGAATPRQLARNAKAAPREAAALFESGAVRRWYEINGWDYPIHGPAASGLAAVQQFFEALGLTRPPTVEISEQTVLLRGEAGTRVEHVLRVQARENRAVYASAVSDQPWLQPGRARLDGRSATLSLLVPQIPDAPGEMRTARVTVTANGRQRFVVPVTLAIAGGCPDSLPPWMMKASGTQARVANGRSSALHPAPTPSPVPPVAKGLGWLEPGQWPYWGHAVPVVVLSFILLLLLARDCSRHPASGEKTEQALASQVGKEETGPDDYPRLGCLFHDRPDALIPEPSMRFGLVLIKEKDPGKAGRHKRLTYDEHGRSNNTCMRLDGNERFFGQAPGRWRAMAGPLRQEPGHERQGLRSVWVWDRERVAVTQHVEIVRGDQTRLLDTCLVRYTIENEDARPHRVGLRFLLDTWIGANDGVPFTVPGVEGLCERALSLEGGEVPAFIQALEREQLQNPGTIAHLRLRLGGTAEPPSRVTLGAWPDPALEERAGEKRARAQLTGWDVPVLPIKTLDTPDSAVAIYWDEQLLMPGRRREVGFTYGLVGIASSEGKGQLALTVGGSFAVGGEFLVTAYVSRPLPKQTVTLSLPEGLSIVAGAPTQQVPAARAGQNSAMSWKIRSVGAEGKYTLRVSSSTGVAQTQPVTIHARATRKIFD